MAQFGIKAFSQNWNLITLKVYFLELSKISTAKQNAQSNLLLAEQIPSTEKGESDKAVSKSSSFQPLYQ